MALILLAGCGTERVYFHVRDPARVTLEADTPEGTVVILGAGATQETRGFRSVTLPYTEGTNPISPASAERIAGGAIAVFGKEILSRRGELKAARRYGDACSLPGAATSDAPVVSAESVRIRFCTAPWKRPCVSVTLVTPRDNVVELVGPTRSVPSATFCTP